MKALGLILFSTLVSLNIVFGQNTPWSTSGSIGIGTTTPGNSLTVVGNQTTVPGNNSTFSSNLGSANIVGNQINITNTTSIWGLLAGFDGPGVVAGSYHGPNTGFLINVQNSPLILGTNNSPNMSILPSGNIGIGTNAPSTRLHIVGSGASIDGGGNSFPMAGDSFAIQANTGGRSATTGAQLEFVIPAAVGGGNPWGQAHIITVAGNSTDNNATGEMILGTRRYFNKLGTGIQWYYGNDLTIDGNGYIGINTTNTYGYQLAVNGSAIATSMTVKLQTNWPDYVFTPTYTLPTLSEVKAYIDQNHHLPEIPGEQEVLKNGVNLGDMNTLLVKKVEELTLYLIEQSKVKDYQNKNIEALTKQLREQQDEINELKKLISK